MGAIISLYINRRGKKTLLFLSVKLVFKKGELTAGYWARINDKSTYSALYVYLDIIPISVKITE